MQHTFKTKNLVIMAFLISLNIIFVRFLGIYLTPSIRISFGFVPIVLMALLFGPMYAAIGSGIGDFLGAIIFPTGGAFFPGFTLSAIITGYIYGKVLYGKRLHIGRIVFANVLVIVIVQLLLNSLWMTILVDKAFIVLVSQKIIKSFIMLPIEVSIIFIIQKYLLPHLQPHTIK